MLAARAVGMRPRETTPEHALRITPRAIALIGLIFRVARFVSIPLAIAIAFAITHGPSIAHAREHAAFGDPAGASDAREPGEGLAWRPILAGCLGVFFGAAVAVWQIRGRKKD